MKGLSHDAIASRNAAAADFQKRNSADLLNVQLIARLGRGRRRTGNRRVFRGIGRNSDHLLIGPGLQDGMIRRRGEVRIDPELKETKQCESG